MKRQYVALIAALLAGGYATAAETNSAGAEQAAKKAAVPEAAVLADEVKDAVAAEVADAAKGADATEVADDAVEVADVAEAAEAAAIAEAGDVDERPKLICKREKPIGSKRIRKTCYTREQLDEQSRRTQDAMYRRNQRTGCPDCGGSGGG